MKTRRPVLGAILSLALITAGFDFRERARLRALRGTAAELVSHYGQIGRKIESEKRLVASAAEVGAALSRAAAQNKNAGSKQKSELDPLRVIALSPELRARYLQLIRDGMDANWSLLFRALKLSPDEAEKLKDLLAEAVANRLTVDEMAADRGLDPDDPLMKKQFNQLDHQNQNAIAALLGPDDYATYLTYYQQHGVAPVIADFAGNLPAGSLSFDQAVQLSRTLSDASQKSQWGFAIYGTIDIDQAVAASAPILKPDQLTALAALLQKNQAWQQYTKLTAGQ